MIRIVHSRDIDGVNAVGASFTTLGEALVLVPALAVLAAVTAFASPRSCSCKRCSGTRLPSRPSHPKAAARAATRAGRKP